VISSMHTVIETPTFLGDCRRARLPDDDRRAMIDAIAEDPLEGEIIPGTGGARKRRFAGRGRGKSGGYRVISFYAGDDVPVLMLALLDKGERANISKAERNMLRQVLGTYAAEHRAGRRSAPWPNLDARSATPLRRQRRRERWALAVSTHTAHCTGSTPPTPWT